MIELQRCSDKEQWDDFILENGGHPLQLWAWGQVKAEHGWKAERLFGYDDDANIVAAAQVLIRPLPFPFRAFAYIPRGPVSASATGVGVASSVGASVGAGIGIDSDSDSLTQSQEFLDVLARRMKQEYHAVALSVEPDEVEFAKPKDWVVSTNKILSAETVLLDVTQSDSELLAHMAKKTRQYIRKSGADVEIRRLRSLADLKECLDIYQQTAQRAGFNLHDLQYYRDIHNQMKDHSPIFGAYKDGKLVSFLWLAISEQTAYELYGGMDERGQELRANYALKWYAIKKVKEWGLSRYDFGGLVAGGVTQFKHGWTDEFTTFAGTFDKPLSPFYVMWSKGLPFAKRTVHLLKRNRRKAPRSQQN